MGKLCSQGVQFGGGRWEGSSSKSLFFPKASLKGFHKGFPQRLPQRLPSKAVTKASLRGCRRDFPQRLPEAEAIAGCSWEDQPLLKGFLTFHCFFFLFLCLLLFSEHCREKFVVHVKVFLVYVEDNSNSFHSRENSDFHIQ